MCPEEVDAAPDLPQSGGIQPLALDNHAQSHGDRLLPDSQHRCLALAQRLALTAPESVLEVNDANPSCQSVQQSQRINPGIERPEGINFKIKGTALFQLGMAVLPFARRRNSWLWLW